MTFFLGQMVYTYTICFIVYYCCSTRRERLFHFTRYILLANIYIPHPGTGWAHVIHVETHAPYKLEVILTFFREPKYLMFN